VKFKNGGCMTDDQPCLASSCLAWLVFDSWRNFSNDFTQTPSPPSPIHLILRCYQELFRQPLGTLQPESIPEASETALSAGNRQHTSHERGNGASLGRLVEWNEHDMESPWDGWQGRRLGILCIRGGGTRGCGLLLLPCILSSPQSTHHGSPSEMVPVPGRSVCILGSFPLRI